MRPLSPPRSGPARTSPVRAARALAGAALLVAGACAEPPVDWSAERSAIASGAPEVLTADGAFATDSLAPLAALVATPGPRCPGSLALARSGLRLYAAWWAVRPDSSARLLAARSDDGGDRWTTPAAVDTTDTSVTGCRREPPSIAADSVSGYVHVAYALRGREGPGVFFSHSMDAGNTFHEVVPILYGERLGRASVAADGDHVAVAFEDPNGSARRIGLALSRTQGHIFEQRILPVSSGNGEASRPMAAVRGNRIAVAWERRAATASEPAVLAIRAGTLR